MSVLLHLARRSRGILLLALATSLISGFGNAGLIALINQALGAPSARLTALGWQFLMLGVVVLVTRTLSQTLFMYLGQHAKATLRMRTIRRIGDASFRHLEQQGASRSLAVLTQDLDAIVVFFVSLPALAMQGAVIAGCLVYLGYLSWQILLFAIVTIWIGSMGFRMTNKRARFHLTGSRRREDDLVKHFRALFDGAKELKLHRERRNAFIDDTLATNVEAVREQRTRGYVLYAAAASWGNFILFAFVGITIFVLTRYYPVDTHVMSGYAMVFLYMIMPIEALLSALPSIGNAKVALERIEQVNADLPVENEQVRNADRGADRSVAGTAGSDRRANAPLNNIVLEGVTHRYFREKENEMFTLGPIDLRFQSGELVFLIGGNGSGKTTLAKMLVGLYPPETGRILWNDQPIGEAEQDLYRQLFSVVFNDFFLFDSLLGIKLEGIDNKAQELLAQLQLDHKVIVKDGTFSTLDLSQGQRKRLALLVAYLEDRPFYLFDEWAADQDPAFKDVFYKQLLPALKVNGKTVVVITHDDRYFHLADRCIKLDYGQLVGEGAVHESGMAPELTIS